MLTILRIAKNHFVPFSAPSRHRCRVERRCHGYFIHIIKYLKGCERNRGYCFLLILTLIPASVSWLNIRRRTRIKGFFWGKLLKEQVIPLLYQIFIVCRTPTSFSAQHLSWMNRWKTGSIRSWIGFSHLHSWAISAWAMKSVFISLIILLRMNWWFDKSFSE